MGIRLAAAAASALLLAADLDELRSLLPNRTGEAQKAVGLVAGLVDATGERFVASGATAPGGKVPPDADTVFEIGSITKVFTSLALADMAARGEVTLDDPVAKLLPRAVRVPKRDGREITLLDLSNQVSGLPRLPDNFKPANMVNPYADYGPAQMYEFLAQARLTRRIGETYEYSNLGVGLLGHALALKAGMSYEELIRRRVLEPLGMSDTAMTLDERLEARLATGTGPNLSPVRNWDFDALAGAGALRSTARDMLRFLAAAMGLRETPLRAAFGLMLQRRRPTGTPGLDIGLGWHIWRKHGTEIVWHNGGTGGYRSFAGFAPAKRTGVVVLCNTSFGVDDLGLHALEPQWPVARFRPPIMGGPVTVPEDVLKNYVGAYELDADRAVTVTVSGGRLYLKETGRPLFEYKAESAADFYRTADDRVTFVTGPSGRVTHLVRYQNGFEHEAPKKASGGRPRDLEPARARDEAGAPVISY
jgi:CubicO group peptidase (beta-lactamase class C family)